MAGTCHLLLWHGTRNYDRARLPTAEVTMATCESVWFDARDAGKPIWGKGNRKNDIIGRKDGWKKCSTKSAGEITVKGRRYLVCEEHKHQIELIATVNPALLTKLRWERRPTS